MAGGGAGLRRPSSWWIGHLMVLMVYTVACSACPVHPGYRFLKTNGGDLGQRTRLVTATGANMTLAYAMECSKEPSCTAFTTQGYLLSGSPHGDWPALTSDEDSCEGVYVRATLAASDASTFNKLTGAEVSPYFDLPEPYYPRLDWDGCLRLCVVTPGCRSVSYYVPEQVCRLKSATCLEAQPGAGCTLVGHNNNLESYCQADRITTFDFLEAPWNRAVAYTGLTSQQTNWSDALVQCQSAGLRLAAMHRRDAVNELHRAASQAVVAMVSADSAGQQNTTPNNPASSGTDSGSIASSTSTFAAAPGSSTSSGSVSGPFLFWLAATHDAASGAVSWVNGVRFLLNSPGIIVESPGGCLALVIPDMASALAVVNGTAGNVTAPLLVVLPCAKLGSPVCAWYPEGVLSARYQIESTVLHLYDNQMPHEDAVAFCDAKGGRIFLPQGVRGQELRVDVISQNAYSDLWIDGYCTGTRCSWRNNRTIPADLPITNTSPDNNTMCLQLARLTPGLLVAEDCSELRGVACLFPPPETLPNPSVPDVPARVRLFGGFAYGFFTASRSYYEAEQQCQLLGGHLASVHDAATDSLISETWYDLDPASNNFKPPSEPLSLVRRSLTYLGADMSTTDTPKWTDGSSFDYRGVSVSKDYTSPGGCLSVSSMSPTGPAKWEFFRPKYCSDLRLNYTCKLPARDYLQFSAAVASEGALFELHDKVPRTYPDAREACLARGGDLASVDPGVSHDDLLQLVRRFRNEDLGPRLLLGDLFMYFVGAITNKTDPQLYTKDFFWQDGTPGISPIWDAAYPPERPVRFFFEAGAKTAGVLSSERGYTLLVRKRLNQSLPFICKVDISQPLASTSVDDGTVYEVFKTPYALPYHAAEQVCQSRGGHLAAAASPTRMSAVAQLCRQAVAELPDGLPGGGGGFASHDVDTASGCWIGLYCPGGYNADVSFKEGFGERGLQRIAADQPGILGLLGSYNRVCTNSDDWLWLDGQAAGGAAATAAAVSATVTNTTGATPLSRRCTLVIPAVGGGEPTVMVAPCKHFAAYVCERNYSSTTTPPALTLRPAVAPLTDVAVARFAAADDEAPSSTPSTKYLGCFTLAAAVGTVAPEGGDDADGEPFLNGTVAVALLRTLSPLPRLLHENAPSLAICASLAAKAGMGYFGVVDGKYCWAGWEAPGLPFHDAVDATPCMRPCRGDRTPGVGSTVIDSSDSSSTDNGGDVGSVSTSNSSSSNGSAVAVAVAEPGCGLDGFTAVFLVLPGVNNDTAAPTATPTITTTATTTAGASPSFAFPDDLAVPTQAFVCLREQVLAAANATLVAKLHVGPTQLRRCEALCAALPNCDLYTYHARWGTCLLLGLPDVASLADVPIQDALWAAVTCAKANRLVAGAVQRTVPGAEAGAQAQARAKWTHVCSPGLAAALRGAGVPALSPRNGLTVGDWAECARSCAANATCQGFAVWPNPAAAAGNATGGDGEGSGGGGGPLLCSTRSGLVPERGFDWLPSRPWLALAELGSGTDEAEGCLALSRLAPAPAYFCADLVDAAGWELARLDGVGEAGCRAACDAEPHCSLYVVYSTPLCCSIRFRTFYNGTVGDRAVGTNLRLNASARGAARSCVHSYRLVLQQSSPAVGRRSRQVRLGSDESWHTCVPHLDSRGFDIFSIESFDEAECAEVCAQDPLCTVVIITNDLFPNGICYAKREALTITLLVQEFPGTAGHSRLDMLTVTDSCYNLDRQLPRGPPSYTCADHYSLALPDLIVDLPADKPFACEAVCDANEACIAYTWISHNGTCVLSTSAPSSSDASSSSSSGASSSIPYPASAAATSAGRVRASGPVWDATQTCLNVRRLLATPASTDSSVELRPIQIDGVWHQCAASRARSTAVLGSMLGSAELLRVRTLFNAGTPNNATEPPRACARLCAAVEGCQAWTLTWPHSAFTHPDCILRGWPATAPLSNPVPDSSRDGGGPQLTCISLDPAQAFPASAGRLLHPQPLPAAVQVYRDKQYTVFLTPMSFDAASAVCQAAAGGGGGQLLVVNSWQELAVVEYVVRPYLAELIQPSAGAELRPLGFWTGLQLAQDVAGGSNSGSNGGSNSGGGGSCSGWCYGHGASTNTTFLESLLRGGSKASTTMSTSASMLCAALVADFGSGAHVASLLPASCADWSLPFICEVKLPEQLPAGRSPPAGPLRIFPAHASYAEASVLAAAAGAVLAAVDLSAVAESNSIYQAPPPSYGGRRSLMGDEFPSPSVPAGPEWPAGTTVLTNAMDAAMVCGSRQLLASGCWLQLRLPVSACDNNSEDSSLTALCGAAAVVVVDAASPAAARAKEVFEAINKTTNPDLADLGCAMAVVSSAPLSGTVTYLPVSCATRAASMGVVIDPELPLQAAIASASKPPPPSRSQPPPEDATGGGGLSAGALAGIVVGSVLGFGLLVLALLGLVGWRRSQRWEESTNSSGREKEQDGAAKWMGQETAPSYCCGLLWPGLLCCGGTVSQGAAAANRGADAATVAVMMSKSLPCAGAGSGGGKLPSQASASSISFIPVFKGKVQKGPRQKDRDHDRDVKKGDVVKDHDSCSVRGFSANNSDCSAVTHCLPGAPTSNVSTAAAQKAGSSSPRCSPTAPASLLSSEAAAPAVVTPTSGAGIVAEGGGGIVAATIAAAAAGGGGDDRTGSPSQTADGSVVSSGLETKSGGGSGGAVGGMGPFHSYRSVAMSHTTNSTVSALDRTLREARACDSPMSLSQLVVTAEDPDQMDVTWQIDPKRDVTWDETDQLGKGTFGVVYRGTYRGQPAAVKTLLRGACGGGVQGKYELQALRSLLQEARILAKVRHPNIVTCYGGCINDTNVFIVEELMSQTLGQLISSAAPALLPLDVVLRVGIDVATGLFQLHPTIVHRDLKPDNVLLDERGNAKISDFGLARFKLSSYLASTKHMAAGTIPYMAPEAMCEELKMISEKADIYSVAIILWAMLTGKQQPWQEYHYAAILYKVSMRGERPPLPEDPARCPPRLAALIQRMWAQDPSARPGAGDVMKHLGLVLRDVQRGAQSAQDVSRGRRMPRHWSSSSSVPANGVQDSDGGSGPQAPVAEVGGHEAAEGRDAAQWSGSGSRDLASAGV